MTIAIRPSDEAGRAKEAIEYAFGKANCFLRKDWTTQISLIRLDKSQFSRTRFFGHAGTPSPSRDLILPDGRIDQREGPASAPIRSLMAASNWLAGAANINRVSS